MTPDGELIPITEDDQGEGYSEPLTNLEAYELVERERKADWSRKVKEWRKSEKFRR